MKLPVNLELDSKFGRLKTLTDSTGRNCCYPSSAISNIISRVSGKSWKFYLPISLLAFVIFLYFGSFAIERGVLPQAKVSGDKVSYFRGGQWRGSEKELENQNGEDNGPFTDKGYVSPWRHSEKELENQNGEDNGPFTDKGYISPWQHSEKELENQNDEDTGPFSYKGYVPPFVLDSSVCSLSEPSNSTAANFVPWSFTRTAPANITVHYDVCLAVSIGDDGDVPNNKAVPYPLVPRLLDAVVEEVANLRKERDANKTAEDYTLRVLVGVDYGSVVCAIVRDTFAEMPGVEAECRTFAELEPNSNLCGKLVVGSSARYVQQVPEEWDTAVGWRSRRYVNLDCLDPAHEPPALPEEEWRPTIVTGFSSNHVAVGLLLIRSLGRAVKQLEGQVNVSVVVWAMEEFDQKVLDRVNCVMDELTRDYGVHAELRTFNWSAHPSWMTLHQELGYMGGTGEYAWKAIMMHTILLERGMVIWADAGDRFETKEALIGTLNYLKSTGFVSRGSPGNVQRWNHPGQLKYFRTSVSQILDMGCCDASIAGFTLKAYREIARPWYDCSLTRQCIAPDGSNRNNHRQDQAALTLLSILSNHPCTGAHSQLWHQADEWDRDGRNPTGADPSKCYSDPF